MFQVKSSAQKRFHLVDLWKLDGCDYPRALQWSPDGESLAYGSADASLSLLDAQSGLVRWRKSIGAAITHIKWNPRRPLVAVGTESGACHVLDPTGQVVVELPANQSWPECLTWSADGELLALAAGRKLQVYTFQGESVLQTDGHPSTITAIGWSARGDALAISCYGGVHIRPLQGEQPARHLPWKGSLISLAWSPNGDVIACGSQDCSVHFWRLSSGKDSEMTGYPSKPRWLAWSADSRLLATSGESTICIWKFEGTGPEGTRPLMLKGHDDLLTQLDFSPVGNILASGSKDADLLLWCPDLTPRPVGMACLRSEITHLSFNRDGRSLAAADASGLLRAWRVVEAS
jgi:WD40 repeat protein